MTTCTHPNKRWSRVWRMVRAALRGDDLARIVLEREVGNCLPCWKAFVLDQATLNADLLEQLEADKQRADEWCLANIESALALEGDPAPSDPLNLLRDN